LPILRRLLRRYPQWKRADRVVCHWAVPFPLLAQSQGVSLDRLRTWCHGSGLRLPGASWMLGRAHPLAVVADHQRTRVPQRFQSRLSLLPVPIDGATEALRQPEKTLIFVGRLVRQKGPDLLPRILDQLPGWKAVVVGDGPLRGQLERDDRIKCLGALPGSVWRQRIGGGVGLCPARSSEGNPLVVDELRLAGVPVVVALVDGLAQRVEQGVDGWVVAGRDPQAWSAAIASAHASTTWSQTRASERAHSDGWAQFADWVLG
jgi:glycosyltransferase involved in cell wall biosynthesis